MHVSFYMGAVVSEWEWYTGAGCTLVLEAVVSEALVVFALCLLSVLLSAKDVWLGWPAWPLSQSYPACARYSQSQLQD